jgi:hypothetical protein
MDDSWSDHSSQVAEEQHRATDEIDFGAGRGDSTAISEIEVSSEGNFRASYEFI